MLHRPPSVVDWAQLAAFIDGEGHIGISYNKRKDHYYLRIRIANTNPVLMLWLVQRFGGSFGLQLDRNPKAKPCYAWVAGSAKIGELLHGCLIYFVLKRELAELALEFQATKRRHSGKRVSPELQEQRQQLMGRMRAFTKVGV